jgi:3-dehydroquinate dehydratase II
VHNREEFRHKSWISPVASGIVIGFGVDGYVIALEALVRTQDKDNAALK